jgi:hypothetical protein
MSGILAQVSGELTVKLEAGFYTLKPDRLTHFQIAKLGDGVFEMHLTGRAEAPPAGLTYEVQYGHAMDSRAKFATFDEALLFYRGYLARCTTALNPMNECRIVNTDRHDGGKHHGLTDEEREAVEEVG